MPETALLPRPRLLQPEQGDGPRSTAGSAESSPWFARALAGDVATAAERLGVPVQTCSLREFSAGTGLLAPRGFTPAEGYALRVEERRVLIGADTGPARFYAVQTLAQLLAGGAPLRRLHCFDWPRLATRGFTLCYHLVNESLPLLAPNYDMALQVISHFSHMKMNVLLLEIESLFPFRKHPAISSRIAFAPEQIQGLREACAAACVKVIPLVQSIGHAYAVLRHPEYAHLRELPDTSQQYCLCNDEVPRFYGELADEVIDAFGASAFHIGGDESRRLGQCPRCREKAGRMGIGGLYADYVNGIAALLQKRGVTPVVWGDIMEDHPDILDKLDPGIEVIYWNYDAVDWNRPYVLESFARSADATSDGSPARTVYAGAAARFGVHGDATFLYQKAMRNISFLSEESVRTGLAGLFITDWTKLAPYEIGMVATAHGAEAAWSGAGDQGDLCGRWAALTFGAAMPGLDRLYRLVSEITLKRKEILNPHWAPPFVDQTVHFMPDWLDRMDWSAWSFDQVLAHYTQQEQLPAAVRQLREGLSRAEEALALADTCAPLVKTNRRLFDVVRLAALNQKVKCALGLGLTTAARLLKFPRPDDAADRRAAAADLRAALRGWEALSAETRRVLLPGTFPVSLENAMRYKLDPAAAAHASRFIGLLESGATVRGLLDGSSW